jgi:hypothetical protein
MLQLQAKGALQLQGQLRVEDGPRRDFKSLGVIEGYMQIDGHKAHILLDGGSTIDMISANFTLIHKLDLFQLKKPVKLQMATSGLQSVINFRAKAEIECGDFSQIHYFDVVNLDRYQVILGTPFLRQQNVILNYGLVATLFMIKVWQSAQTIVTVCLSSHSHYLQGIFHMRFHLGCQDIS